MGRKRLKSAAKEKVRRRVNEKAAAKERALSLGKDTAKGKVRRRVVNKAATAGITKRNPTAGNTS